MAPSDLTTLAATAPALSVGILTADLLSLGSALTLLEDAGVALVHVDVMDGCFCPMMTVGPPFVKALKTPLLKDVHLMIDEIDLVLLLAINPGWGGQRFIPATFDRLARAKAIVGRAGRRILVGVDGGITKQNVTEVARAGADLIVTGSAVFDGRAAADNARFMLRAVQPD